MPADQVSAEPLSEADGWFEVDLAAFIELAEGGYVGRFHGDVRGKSIVGDFDGGQTYAVDRYAFTDLEILPSQIRCLNRQPQIAGLRFDLLDCANGLDDSCEHCLIEQVLRLS